MSNEILDNLEIEEDKFPDSEELSKLKIVKIIAVVQFIMAIVATVLEYEETETIMGTGPIGSILGIFLFSRASKMPHIPPFVGKEWMGGFISFRKTGMIIGLSAPIFSFLCFLVIAIGSLSPKEAHEPVFIGLCAYTVFLFLITSFLFGSYQLGGEKE